MRHGFLRHFLPLLCVLAISAAISHAAEPERVSLATIRSPILFRGDATTAYRDPAVIYHDGWFRLFFTLVKIDPDKRPFSQALGHRDH